MSALSLLPISLLFSAVLNCAAWKLSAIRHLPSALWLCTSSILAIAVGTVSLNSQRTAISTWEIRGAVPTTIVDYVYSVGQLKILADGPPLTPIEAVWAMLARTASVLGITAYLCYLLVRGVRRLVS